MCLPSRWNCGAPATSCWPRSSTALHGYAIATAVRELSDGTVNLTSGTLYGALRRMAAGGLLEVKSEETVQGRRRRSYRLTDAGREALVREAMRLEAAARLVPH